MLSSSPDHSQGTDGIFIDSLVLEFPQAPYSEESDKEDWNSALKEELDSALQQLGLFLTGELPKNEPSGSYELIFEGKGVKVNMEEVARVLGSFRDTFSFVLSHEA